MKKIVAAINMTLDGFCDHTAMDADDELHQHYYELLRDAGALIYGRITYQLMESYWPAIVKNPTGNKPTDDFAVVIENIPKIVFSHTLNNTDPTITGWKNVKLAERGPGLIVALTNLNLIDEYQLCVHPVIAGTGLPLFKTIKDRVTLKLLKTKTFNGGQIILYYESIKK
jgi:dihydrofolate reductase